MSVMYAGCEEEEEKTVIFSVLACLLVKAAAAAAAVSYAGLLGYPSSAGVGSRGRSEGGRLVPSAKQT